MDPVTTTHSSLLARSPRGLLPLAVLALGTLVPAQQEPNERVALAREALGKLAETERAISNERQQWRLGKEAIETRMQILDRETQGLEKRIEEQTAKIGETERKRAELLAEKERLKGTSASLERRIGELEQRVLAMLPRLPEPLREQVRQLTQRLPASPEKAAESKMTLNDRYLNVIGVLNEVSKWNRGVTVSSEVRQQTDGSSVEVAVIYFGLGQAYYTGSTGPGEQGKVAGIGTATSEGWTWKPANELADAVRAAIGVYKDEQLATLVRLPVQIL